ncbi:MAG: hypothetical protein ABW321_30090, partial [Polyangiales bacterium]
RPIHWLHVGIQVAGPIAGARITNNNGRATIHQELAWLEARLVWLRAGDLQLALLLGGGAYFAQAYGEVSSPLTSRDDSVWSWLMNAGAHADYALSNRFSITLAVRALALLPRTGVAIDTDTAIIDLPALETSLGLAIGL